MVSFQSCIAVFRVPLFFLQLSCLAGGCHPTHSPVICLHFHLDSHLEMWGFRVGRTPAPAVRSATRPLTGHTEFQNSCHLLLTFSMDLTATPLQDEGAQVSTQLSSERPGSPIWVPDQDPPPHLFWTRGLEGTWLQLRLSVSQPGQTLGVGDAEGSHHVAHVGSYQDSRRKVWMVSDPSLAGLS